MVFKRENRYSLGLILQLSQFYITFFSMPNFIWTYNILRIIINNHPYFKHDYDKNLQKYI